MYGSLNPTFIHVLIKYKPTSKYFSKIRTCACTIYQHTQTLSTELWLILLTYLLLEAS